MAKTIQVFVNTGKDDDNQLHEFVQGSGAKGKPTRIKAVKGARYQLKDPALKEVGPEYIRSKRVGKNLHVSLDGSNEADLIIEGYYDEGYLADDSTGLYGKAEDGQIYEYIPEDPTPAGLAANLTDGAMPVSQVLGGLPMGEAFALSGLPLLAAAGGGIGGLLAGAALLGAAAIAANRNNGTNTTTNQTGGLSSDSDSGSSNTDGITNNKTPSYSGKASPGATVEVTINGKTYTTVADANGNYVVKIPATDALPDGTYTPKIKVTNTNGTTSTVDGTPFTIDTSTTGTGGLTHDAANDTGSSTGDNITNNTKPSFSGTGEPGATVKIVVDGQTLTAVVGADGKWVASGPYTGNGLTGGQHAVVITFTDVAGNTSTVNAAPVFISTGVGNITLSVDAVTADNTISGTEASINVNTDITGKASGEFKAGQIVTLTINGKTFSGPVDGTGAYKISVPTADLLADSDKTIAASIAVTDAAGNTGTVATTHAYLVDNTAPNATTTTLTIDNVTTDNIIVGSENTAGASTNITGKAFGEFQAGDVVTLTINGKTFTGKVGANGSYSIPVPVADLVADPDTKIDATLAATDHVGNIGSIVAAHSYTTDTVGPTNATTSVTVNPVTADNLINATEAGQVTIDITGRVTGEFKAGDIVTLSLNANGVTKTFSGAVDATGNYRIPVTTADLIADTDKTITSSVVAHDAAGNTGTVIGNSQTYLVDNTAPNSNGTTLIIDAVADDNIINLVESKNTNTTVTGKVVGEFTVGDIVTLTINGHTYTAAVAANGTYSTSVLTSDLTGDAAKTITGSLAAHDAAGNTGTITATRPYIVDITPPDANPGTAAINVDPVTDDNLINSADAAITNTTIKGTVTGEFKAGDIVTLKLVVNGTTKTYTGAAAADGSYSIPVLTSDLVNDSDKTIEASVAAHDAAGNVGTVSTTQIYAVDTTNPNAAGTALSVNPVTADNVINLSESGQTNTTITGKVTGVFTGGDVVTLTVNGNAFTGRVDTNGNYSINVATADLLGDTDKTIAASIVAHNSSGNAGTITDTQTYTVDTTPPSATTTTLTVDVVTPDNIVNGIEGATGAADIAITGKAAGTFTAGDAVTLTINNQIFTGNVAADGSYSINVPAADLVADSDKKIDASIAAHDAAGNLGTVTSARTYAVDTVAPTSATTALTIDPVTADNIINAAENGIANTTVTGKATGEFKSGDQVTLTINNKAYTGTVNATGNFSISVLTSDLVADADKTIAGTIAATDAAGNVAAAGAIKADHLYLVDTTGPSNATTALSVNVVATDDTLNAAEAGLASIPVTGKVTGEFVAGDVVTLTVNGKPFTGQVDASGNYSINVASADLIADTGKTIAASIVAHDTVGNAGTVSATHPYLVDTVAPSDSTTTISVNVITPDNIINSLEAGQTKTAVTGIVAGEFTAGDTVTITVNGHTATGTVAANGTYTVDVLTADLVAETGKTLTATVAAHDAAGNVGNVSTNHRYAVDTIAPNGGAALGLTIDPDTNNDGIISYTELSGATSLNVTATFDKTKVAVGDIVTFTPVSGTAQTVTLTQAMVDAGKVTVAFATPANGSTLDVTATLSDVAGNATVPARDTATLNNTNPNASATIDIAAITTDSGTAGDFVTNDTTLTYTGTLTGFTLNGDKVKVELLDASGAVVETQTVTPTSATTWTFTPTAAQAAGNYTLRATIVDAAGARVNATAPVNGTNGGQDTQLIVIDTVVPTTTVNITAISEDTGVSATDFITKDNNGLTVSATLSTALATGEKLFYSRDNGVTWIDITSSVNGTAVTHIDSLLTSTTTVQMRVQDVAGNVGSNDTQLITIDTVAPTPVVSPEDPLNPPAGKASLVLDPITADNIITSAEGAQAQVPVTGTAHGDFTAGDTVTLTINNKTFTGTVDSNGKFSINVPGADLLADADTKVEASLAAHDKAGNLGAITATQTYTVTTTAPNGGKALGLTIDADTNNDGLINFAEIGNTNGTPNTVLSVSASFNPSLVKVGDIITFTPAGGTAKTVTLTAADIKNGFATTTFTSPGDNATFNVKATITDGTLGNTGPEATDSARFDLSNLNPVSPSTKQGVGIRIDTDRDNNGAGDGILNTAEINGGTTASVTVTLPSDAKAGDVLVITGTGNDAKSITLSDAQILAGSITTTFSLPANGIELKVTAQVTDAAGNTSNLATDTATVNTTPVGSPILEITTDKDNSGFINRVELGSATTISVKTTLPTTTSTTAGASVGDTITVTDGTNTQKHKLTQADITAGFVTDTFAKPAEGGTINVSATLTNTAGNISQPGTDSAVLDTSSFVDPTDPTKSGLKVIIDTDTNNDGTISGAELTATFKATVTLPAQAAAGDTLTLNASGNNPRTITLTAADIAAGKVEVSGLTPTGNGTTFTVSASLVDRAGNASPTPDASDSAVIKTSAPNGGVAPTVEITTDANNDGIVNATELNGANTFSVKGSFDKTKVVAGDQMVFTDGTNTQTVTLTATDIGNGFATTTFPKPAENGTLTVSAAVRDNVGNSTPSSVTDSASLDTTAPNAGVAPIVTIATDADNNGIVSAAELNNASTFTVKGAFSNGAVVGDKVVFTAVVGTQTLTQTVTLTSTDISNGFATTTFNKPAENGSMTVTALIQDAAGNTSAISASDTASLDTTAPNGGLAPTVEITTDANNDGLVSAAELNGATTFTVKGSFDKTKVVAGDKLIFSDGSATPVVVTLTATDISNGFATTTFAKPAENAALTVTVKVQDAAGNNSPVSTSDTATLDTTAPNAGIAPIVTIATDADNNGIVNIAELNGASTFTVKGAFSNGAVVGDKVVFTAVVGTQTLTQTVTLTSTDISNGFATTTFNKPAENGSMTVTALIQDAAGNTSAISASDTASLDTTAPNGGLAPAVEITTDANNDGLVNAAELNGATTFTVKGSFDKTKVVAGDKLIFSDGSATPVVVTLTATDISNGFATTTFAKPAENAALTVTVKVQDAAGNNSPVSTSDTATLDTTAPNGGAAPTVEITTDANNDGLVSAAELNGATTFTVKGSFDKTKVVAGDKLVFSDNSTTPVVSTVVLTAADIANGFATTTFNKPAENAALTVTVKVQDAAGNNSPVSASDTATLDTTAPNGGAAPTVEITTDANNDGLVSAAELNGATTFTVKGSFDKTKVVAGDKLVFSDNSTTPVVSTVVLTAADIANGFATTTFNKPAENAALTVTVKVQDAAGNNSPVSTSDTATLDTTAPNGGLAPTVEITTDADNNGFVTTSELSGATTFTVKGSFDKTKVIAGDKLVFTAGGVTNTVILTATDISNGFATTTFNKPVEGGTLTATVQVQDAAGNSSPVSASDSATLDTTAPNGGAAPTVLITTDANNDGVVNATELNGASTFTVKGSFDKTKVAVGDKLIFSNGSSTPVVVTLTATDISNGFATTTFTKPAEGGDLTVTAQVQDAAGNNSAVSASDTATLHTTTPNGGVAPTVEITTDADNNGFVTVSELNGASTFAVKGSFDKTKVVAGDKLVFTAGGVTNTVILTATDISNGFAITTFNKPTEGAALAVTVLVQDTAGNTSPASASDSATLDTTLPNGGAAVGLTIDLDANNDGNINTAELGSATTTSLTATFDGTKVNVGDKVTFSDGTTTHVVTLTQTDLTAGKVVDAGWTVPADGSTLHATAVLTDAAGNATPQATDSAKVDTTAPNGGAAPIVTIITDANDDGLVSTTELNGATTFTVQGDFDNTKVVAGDSLVFTSGGVTHAVVLTATDITNGFATTTFNKPANGSTLTVSAVVQDAAGNASPVSATDSATLDTTAPTLAITLSDAALTAGETSTVTFTFSEAVANFDATDINVAGAQGSVTGLTQSTTNPAVWTATFTPISNIVDTTNIISVAANSYTDIAGNNGAAATSPNFTIDTQVPSVTITMSDVALKAGETSLVTYTFSQAPSGFAPSDVTISGAQGTISDPVQSSTDPKVWTATFTPTADIEDTTNVISIAAGAYTNSAGVNGTEGTSANFVIDTKAPTLTIVMSDSALVVGETSTVTFTFSEAPTGFSAADITVPTGIGAISGLAATSNPLVWTATFTPATNLASTNDIISVAASTYTDAAGNNGGAAQTSAFTIDTTVPTVTVAMDKSALKGGDTSVVTFTFSQVTTDFALTDVDMTGAQGALSNLVQVGGASSKVWTATFTPTAQVEDAVNVIKVTAGSYTNASGNKGTEGVSANFTIDTLPPSTTITIDAIDDNVGTTTGTVASGGVTDDTTPTVKGTLGTALATGETVHIFDNGVDIGTATISVGSTAFTFTDSRGTIVDGSNLKYTAKVFDAAGNSGTASNLYTATITTTVPTITVTSVALDTIDATHLNGLFDTTERAALIGSAKTLPIISGTTTNVDVGQTVSVTLNGHTYTGTVAGTKASGTWSISVTEADALLLNHGNTYDIKASVSDAAGQTATDTDNKLEVKVGALDVPTVIDVKTNIHTPTLTGVAQKFDTNGAAIKLDDGDILEISVKNSAGTVITLATVSATISSDSSTYPAGFSYDKTTKTWTFDTSAVSGLSLPDDTYEVIVLAKDTAPNPDVTKADISTSELIIDSTAPVFSSLTTASVAENIDISVAANAVVYTAAASDTTTGNHGATYSLKAGVGDAAKFSIDAATGKVSIKESPNFEDPNRTNHQYTFTVEATDTFGNKSEKAVTVNVTNVNEAPVAVADTATAKEAGGIANGTAGTDPTGNVLTNDTDVDANDTLSVKDIKASSAASATAVSASTTSANGTIVTGNFGTIKIGADGSYVYTVDNTNATVQALNTSSTALTDVFTYTVKDAAGLTSTATITVSVNGANDAPTVANAIADTTGTNGTALTYVIPANSFADVDNATLTLSATLADGSALPSWLSFNASTRTFSGTPTATGTVSVKVTATDAGGLSANDTFDIVVGAANAAPVANPTTVNNAFAQAVTPTVAITDDQSAAYVANGTVVTYTLKFSKPINASSLTASDLKLTGQDSTFTSVLTQVDSTTWTYTAKAATTGSTPMVLSMADGAYTSTTGEAGLGGSDVQNVGVMPAPVPGPVIKVNSAANPVASLDSSSIETLSDGGWVVTYNTSGTASDYFQRYDAAGNKVGNEVSVGSLGTSTTVADLANGGFAIVASNPTAQTVSIVLYDATSTKGSTITLSTSAQASVAGLSDGTFVVTARSTTTTGSNVGSNMVYHFDSSGTQIGSLVALDNGINGNGTWVTKLSNGGFVTVWDKTDASSHKDVFFQMFDASGNKVGGITKANTTISVNQADASVAELDGGGFVVAWMSSLTSGSTIVTQRFDALGNKVGLEVTAGVGNRASVEGLVGGGYVVTATNGNNVIVQNYDASGNAVGSLVTLAAGNSSIPHITALPNGGYVLTYRITDTTGTYQAQIIYGPTGAIVSTGTAAADTLTGGDKADTITGVGGADIIYAGSGDDKVILNTDNVTQLAAANTMVVNGGTGVNTLQITNTAAGTGATLDLTSATVAAKLHGFSSIDITGPAATANTLKLDYKAISTLSGATDNAATTTANESKMLVVSGDAGDTVQLVDLTSWNVVTSQTAASLAALYGKSYNFVTGHTYKAYTLNGATLFVDDAVTLSTLAASTGGGGAGTTSVAVTEAKTVQQLFGPSFTDTDAGQSFKGVAISSAGTSAQVSATGAHYEFSTDGGTTWTALAAGLTDSTAVFLAPTALIRFAAAPSSAVAVPTADLKAYLVDTSGQTNTTSLVSGNTTNASVHGGSTAFSDVPVVVSVVNSAPVPAGLTTVADPFGKANFEITPVGTPAGYGTLNTTTIGNTTYVSNIPGAGTGGFFIDNLPWLASSQAWSITNTSIDITISKPLPYVDVYFSNWDEATASSIQFKVNGTIYKFTGAELQNLAKVTTALASGSTVLSVATATYSADGTMFLGSTDAATKLGGSFRIPAPSGGITSFSILSQDPDGARFGLLATDVSVSTIPVTSFQTVSALFGGSQFSDVDALDKFKGVVITNAGATADITAKGKYQFSTDNGTTWTDLAGGLTDATGVYLKSTDLVRYKSASATATAIKQNLVAHLVDTSTASSTFTTSGATVDVSGTHSGGSTAVSSAAITIAGSTAPVVLDLNHDGVLSYGQVQMDVLGTGHLQQTAWAGAHDGVLVWDKQADGQVHDNSQYAFAQYGAAGSTDLQGLAAGFDSNHDGVLDAKDAKFAQFAVWQDANQDGVVEAGEMHSLSEAGITAINLTSDGVVRVPNAQVVEAGHSTAQLADGSTMVVADAEFGVQALSYHIDTTAPDATKLVLTGAGMDLNLSTFAAKHGAIAEVDVSGTGANSIKLTLVDLLQGTPHAALKITGDADDSANVNLADWTNTGNTVVQNGHTYAVYNDAASHTAQLLIDQNLVNAGHVI